MTATALDAIRLALSLPPGTRPTPEQRAKLRGFEGWGPLAKAFDTTPEGKWLQIADDLDDLLSEEAFAHARDQVDTSFFTPPTVTDALFRVLAATGFTGGNAVELGCGSGLVIDATPEAWDVSWTAVEIDPTSARIASLLNPDAKIHTGRLEETALADGQADAVVGNVPFSSARVHDPSHDFYGNLHGYFFHRAMLALRPGGYAVLITSRHMLDGGDLAKLVRGSEDVAFIGAVRLPSGVFPGTEVPADIVVLRRNDEVHTVAPYRFAGDFELAPGQYREMDMRPMVGGGTYDAQPISRYWEGRTGQIAGVHEATGAYQMPLRVKATNPVVAIGKAVAELIDSGLPAFTPRQAGDDLSDVILESPLGHAEGSFQVWEDGQIVKITDGQYKPVRASEELRALITLRDIAVELVDLEAEYDLDDDALVPIREVALDQYEAYVAEYGPLNRGTLVEGKVDPETGLPALSWRRPPMAGFRSDPASSLVFALEVFDQDTGEAAPAPILTRRVNRRPVHVDRVDTAAEAVSVSLGESGRIDLDRIRDLLALPDEEATRAALSGLVFWDERGECVSAAEYLSGDVRAKLARAEAAGLTENAEALRGVVPDDLGPLDITITPSNPLITAADVEAFMRDDLGFRAVSVSVEGTSRVWDVNPRHCWGESSEARMNFATPDMELAKIVEHMLMSRLPEVKDRVVTEDGERYVKNPSKSAAAAEKVALLADRFTTWLWEDKERAERICGEYNARFNAHVPRVYTGEGFTFPGLADTFTPYTHQRAAVERIVTSERAFIAHPVGAGKTASMLMSAMTLKQLGLITRGACVVPNHLLDQIAREAQQLYPTGRFLIASRDDLTKDARRLFAARCATGNWDAVIMTHAAFTSIPVHPDTEEAYLAREKAAKREAMIDAEAGSKGAKAIARAMKSVEAKIGRLRDGVGDSEGTVWFDQLGIDWLAVDEAHLFRRLDTGSTNRDSGFGSGVSKRATDLHVKIEALAEKHPGKPIVGLFSGTPFSNTLAEMWVWQRMLQPDVLDQMGLTSFDAWTGSFIRYESNIEVAPDGSGFRMFRRPVGVVNAPELKTMFGQVADILDPASLGLARPDSTEHTVIVDPSPEQAEYVKGLAARADAIRGNSPTPDGAPEEDNMLLICGDGRSVAVDPRLRGIDEESTKLARAAELIADAHHEQAERRFGQSQTPGAFQLVFLDQGTPKPDTSASYGRLRAMLVARGIPAEQIRFVHDAKTDKARAALFASCRDGSVSVLIGSTPKLGMGTNIQTRLTHIWHLDAPWLPADMIQRDGRGIRPGNFAGHVTITRLATEGSFDSVMYQAIQRKSQSFDALYATGATAREIEDVSQATLSFAEVKALASGNPLLLEQAKVRAEVKRLQMLRSVHLQSVSEARQRADFAEQRARSLRNEAALLDTAAPAATAQDDGEKPGLVRLAERHLAGSWAVAPWRGFRLDHGRAGTVRLAHEGRTLGHVDIPAKVDRRGADGVARYLAGQVNTLIDEMEERAAKHRARAVELDEQAADARAAVERAVFDSEDALQTALAEAARIDTLIASEVTGAGVQAA